MHGKMGYKYFNNEMEDIHNHYKLYYNVNHLTILLKYCISLYQAKAIYRQKITFGKFIHIS